MEFRGVEAGVVDLLRARELQRLRRIRQLGLVHLVFPSAEHSRLAHALGAAHVAIRFARRLHEATQELLTALLRPDEDARRDLALAALCHDLGHGPLSHAFEQEIIGDDFDRVAWGESLGLGNESLPAGLKWHELVGQGILAWPDGELHKLLEEQEEGTAARIRTMLLGEHHVPYLPRLLASDVDVDRCDFLLRDAQQSGVAYGRFDLNWLISTAAVGDRNGELVVGFDSRKAPRVIEQFIVARRALYDTVYQHKTVKAAEGMVGLLLRCLRHVVAEKGWLFGNEELFAPYKHLLEGQPLSPEQVLGLDDYSLWVLIMHVAKQDAHDPTAADLAQRILARDLFKQVPVAGRRIETFLGGHDRSELYPVVRPHCSPGDPRYYIHMEFSEFKTLSGEEEREKEVYLVEPAAGGPGQATLAREHPELKALFRPGEEAEQRLFAPREAIEDLRKTLAP